ncbi:uncharacterized protein KGF55_005137 [Candida pseudojiufengensis]|uniref:uncharacterized protein n=1 Tax=Candida pseudojiufengensis TaxID=497109 RepID=UPI0022254AD7|nr:uncharacterized protein KGF55_005137 [Candida pseudojiufengensis]KAI5959905.1 hypothetical protein KGF55_005137 [Candida pseudojiufengensis]
MHTHHSHSGDYVSHANDPLEDMVNLYIKKGFKTLCLTEHMPRIDSKFLYPEELDKSYTSQNLFEDFHKYLNHAQELKIRHKEKIDIIVGFEIEGINQDHINLASRLIDDPKLEMSVGSVHFVHEIPIDFSEDLWVSAKQASLGGSTRSLYKSYFELQSKIIDLKPTVIGHFDLIRLCQPQDDYDETTNKLTKQVNIKSDWPEVWELILNNIIKVIKYGGLIELNSSAIRKGWDVPYPQKDIAEAIVEAGGKFCLSDDAHALSQIGLNYHRVLSYAKDLGIKKLYHVESTDDGIKIVSDTIEKIESSPFWNQYK